MNDDLPDKIYPHPGTAKELAVPVTLNPEYLKASHIAEHYTPNSEVKELLNKMLTDVRNLTIWSDRHFIYRKNVIGIFKNEIELLNTSNNKHDWKCISAGMYDDLYKCRTCGKQHIVSADNPESELPVNGCTQFDIPSHIADNYTKNEKVAIEHDSAYLNGLKAGWNLGLTKNQDHYELIVKKFREEINEARKGLPTPPIEDDK